MQYRAHQGESLSEIGMGCYAISGAYGLRYPKSFVGVLRHAYESGVTLFDRITIRLPLLALLVVSLTTGLAACGASSSPPGASKALGAVAQGGYLFLRWQQGLEVMIWHDLAGGDTADGGGSATGRLYVEHGSVHAADGRSLTWEVQTVDGMTGQVLIGGVRYDLTAGDLFIVNAQERIPAVRQLSRDLSAVPLDHEGIIAFAQNDPDLVAFLKAAPTATPTPTGTPTATPTPTDTPTATPTPTDTPTATPTHAAKPRPSKPTCAPGPAAERILFAPGATQATIEGYLPDGGCALYVMSLEAGQFVEMDASAGTLGPGLRCSIVGADGIVVKPMGPDHVKTVVPSTQDYYVKLVSDVGATSYWLSVLIPVRVRFATGSTSATVTGSLAAGDMRYYVLRAMGGQRMIVSPHTTRGQVGMTISGVDGQVLLSGRVGLPGVGFDGLLPSTQDYLISMQAEGGTGAQYSLEITVAAEEPEPGDTLLEERTVGEYTLRLWQPAPGDGLYNYAILSAPGQPEIRIEAVVKIGSLPAEDITGDGFPDVELETYAGGSHCCAGTVVYNLGPTPQEVLHITSSVGADATGLGIFQDLDGDGVYEFITADALGGIPCTAPTVKVILRYEPGQGYVGASPCFPLAYAEDLSTYTQAAEAGREATRDGYECDVYPLLVTYLYMGQPDIAREALDRYYLGPDPDGFFVRLQQAVAAGRFYVPQ